MEYKSGREGGGGRSSVVFHMRQSNMRERENKRERKRESEREREFCRQTERQGDRERNRERERERERKREIHGCLTKINPRVKST
jgi:hypothetical protein